MKRESDKQLTELAKVVHAILTRGGAKERRLRFGSLTIKRPGFEVEVREGRVEVRYLLVGEFGFQPANPKVTAVLDSYKRRLDAHLTTTLRGKGYAGGKTGVQQGVLYVSFHATF